MPPDSNICGDYRRWSNAGSFADLYVFADPCIRMDQCPRLTGVAAKLVNPVHDLVAKRIGPDCSDVTGRVGQTRKSTLSEGPENFQTPVPSGRKPVIQETLQCPFPSGTHKILNISVDLSR